MSKDDWIKINCHTKRQKTEKKSPNKRAPQTHHEWEEKKPAKILSDLDQQQLSNTF